MSAAQGLSQRCGRIESICQRPTRSCSYRYLRQLPHVRRYLKMCRRQHCCWNDMPAHGYTYYVGVFLWVWRSVSDWPAGCIFSRERHLSYEITQWLLATRHSWTRLALTLARRRASTRFTYPGGMEGWVDLGGLLYRDGLFAYIIIPGTCGAISWIKLTSRRNSTQRVWTVVTQFSVDIIVLYLHFLLNWKLGHDSFRTRSHWINFKRVRFANFRPKSVGSGRQFNSDLQTRQLSRVGVASLNCWVLVSDSPNAYIYRWLNAYVINVRGKVSNKRPPFVFVTYWSHLLPVFYIRHISVIVGLGCWAIYS